LSPSSPDQWVGPYGLPPVAVVINSGCVYGSPITSIPWCSSGIIIDSKVDSWPPCRLPVEVNTAAGLPASVPASQSAEVPSKKYFIAAAMLPKRVGEPIANPAQSARSCSSTYGAPLAGMSGAVASVTVDTAGTVRSRASAPGTLSTPWAISSASLRVAPWRE
jgi:hypothetical protein